MFYVGGGKLTFRIEDGGMNNKINVAKNVIGGRMRIVMRGNNNTVVISDECKLKLGNTIFIQGDNNRVFIGKNVTFDQNALIVVCEGTEVTIGANCIFANGVTIRTSDQHAIYDSQGKRINMAKNVVIGNHVWLGAHVVVMKGTNIGDGSIIGMCSMVTKNIPNNTIAVGTPAKVKKEDIHWSETLKPKSE